MSAQPTAEADKQAYRALCDDTECAVPLFQQAWWMDVVSEGKEWNALVVRRADGRVEAALPYLVARKLGQRYVLQPRLTQFSGPWFRPTLDFAQRRRAAEALVQGLEAVRLTLFQQCFAPEASDWLPFYWAGYRQTTRYTYRIAPLAPVDELMRRADPERRKRMSLLRSQCQLDREVPVDEFVDFHHDYYMRRSGTDWVPVELVRRVCTAALGRRQALLYGLRDADGHLLTADFVVYDAHCAHSLLSGLAVDAPRNCTTLLFWNLIDDLRPLTEAFDFEGSMDRGIEHFFRSFGAQQTPYHCVCRSRPRWLAPLLGL